MPTTDFLGQLDATARGALLAEATHQRLRKGDFVFRVGDPGNAVFVLLAGRVKTYKIAPSGRQVILWFGFPGEVFGITEVSDAKGRRVNVQACEDSQVATVPEAAFGRFLDSHPGASRLLRRVMSARLGILANVLVNLVVDDAHARIAKLILHLGARYGVRQGEVIHLQIPLTHQEIANMTGVNRQTASRILGEFRREGLLSIDNRRIHIESTERLSGMTHRTD